MFTSSSGTFAITNFATPLFSRPSITFGFDRSSSSTTRRSSDTRSRSRISTDEQLERTFRTNIFAYIYMARAAVAHMQPGSAIVNTGSIAGLKAVAATRLLGNEGRHPRVHQVTRPESRGEADSRELCRAGYQLGQPLNVADKPAKKAREARPG